MSADDIPQIADIERESFPSMWPQTAYRRELANKIARYTVITEPRADLSQAAENTGGIWSTIRRLVGGEAPATDEYVLGVIGLWLMVGEAHIVTVAVREAYRRSGIGERLLIASTELALQFDQEVLTLEVRASNVAAQRLYEKYGFATVGRRVRYYTDDHEDAVIMTTPPIASPGYRALCEERKARHRSAHPDLWS